MAGATRLLEAIRAVLFDMDGTLIDSPYDWRAIRAELGVAESSLIDALNALPSPQREAKWRRLTEIERRATRDASLMPGARELVAFCRRRGMRTALVTNNTAENTAALLHRFALELDLVVTRDDGFWKPSGAPLSHAVGRLRVPASACLAVGDNRYDLDAAREAGCGRVVILNADAAAFAGEADACFPDARSLLGALEAERPAATGPRAHRPFG